MIASARRYELDDAAPPTQMASSASATCGVRASGSEKMPTVLMPSLLAVLIIRQAISPRLATRSFLKSGRAAAIRVSGWLASMRVPKAKNLSSLPQTP